MSAYNWMKISRETISDKLSRKVISGERVMLAQIFLNKGCTVGLHSHESEQMSYILSGSMKFRLPDKEVTLNEGDVLHIPPEVEHSAVALEDTLDLEIFSPIREDWLKGTHDYSRK